MPRLRRPWACPGDRTWPSARHRCRESGWCRCSALRESVRLPVGSRASFRSGCQQIEKMDPLVCPPPSRREGSGSLRAKHLRPGASSLAEVVPHEPHEALVLLVHAGRDAEVAVLAVAGLDALPDELLHVHARLQDLGGALAGHGGVDEHVVAVGWVRPVSYTHLTLPTNREE